MTPAILFTIGHGNRSSVEFLESLEQANVHTVIDIRAFPYPVKQPWFTREKLQQQLQNAGLGYLWAGKQLGGMRDYAEYIQTPTFRTTASLLRAIFVRRTTAIMGSALMPEQCHRQFIADYMVQHDTQVIHLLDNNEMREHVLSEPPQQQATHWRRSDSTHWQVSIQL